MSKIKLDGDNVETVRTLRLRRRASQVGGIAMIGVGIVHTVTNSVAFALSGADGSWPMFLLFNPGLSAVIITIGVVTWRQARPGSGRWPARVVIGVGAAFCMWTLVNVLSHDARLVWVPIGPGPWVLVGTPALLLSALLPTGVARRSV